MCSRNSASKPLFISQPFNGVYRDLGGTTRRSRQIYYDKLAEFARAGRLSVAAIFPTTEEDRFFFNDAGHPSAKAWIFYDEGNRPVLSWNPSAWTLPRPSHMDASPYRRQPAAPPPR